MKNKSYEAHCLSCKGVKTKEWHAWLNLMPPLPNDFHIVGKVQVPNPGVEPLLFEHEPQGVNPTIFLADLFLYQRPGGWPDIVVWKPVRFEKTVEDPPYRGVKVLCGKETIAKFPVKRVY
ncbi:MAG: hypothetical protein MI755_22905 [Sphingomonadales bacterium]|nr:hypothetical protein [Sphingomonadales bacterium]